MNVACNSSNSCNLIECLRTKSTVSLVNGDVGLGFMEGLLLNWLPTNEVKHNDAFLTDIPKNFIDNKAIIDLPFMSGTVSDEGLLVTAGC